jgi:hypothetical protein
VLLLRNPRRSIQKSPFGHHRRGSPWHLPSLLWLNNRAQSFLCFKDDQAALRQFSQEPYFELKVPPPLCWACSEITTRAQTSQVLAISPSDMGCERLRREMLNLDLAFIDRSSYSLLLERVAWDQNMAERRVRFRYQNIKSCQGKEKLSTTIKLIISDYGSA